VGGYDYDNLYGDSILKQGAEPHIILGGTFDPVHNGHLAIAHAALALWDDAIVHFMPCKLPVHKDTAHAANEDRLAMLQAALGDDTRCRLDSRELERDTPSYMILSLQSLREELPSAPLILLIGWDAWVELPTWYEWRSLFDFAHICVVNRVLAVHNPALPAELDAFFEQRKTQDPDVLREEKAGSVYYLTLPLQPYASRDIRRAIASGESVHDDLPSAVESYIESHHLYKE